MTIKILLYMYQNNQCKTILVLSREDAGSYHFSISPVVSNVHNNVNFVLATFFSKMFYVKRTIC